LAIVKCAKCGRPYQVSEAQFLKTDVVVFPCLACKNPITLEKPPGLREDEFNKKEEKQGKKRRLFKRHSEAKIQNGDALKKEIFRSLENLPPISRVVSEALEVMADPNSVVEDIAKAIETDQSMVSNVIRLVNSAYYSLPNKISSIQQACVLLGNRILREIIIMAGVSNLLEKNLKGYGFASGELWRHSVASALGAKIIAGKEDPDLNNDAYIAGLIHDMGKITLNPYVLERIELFSSYMDSEKKDYLEAEKSILGFDHAEIAYELCIKWKFPENIAFAIQHHHQPSLSQGDELSYIVHMADFLAKFCGFGQSMNTTDELEKGTMEFLSLEKEHIDNIVSEINESMKQFDL
jgi:HD-like signal output (HDOD) protein